MDANMPSSHVRLPDFLWIVPSAALLGFAQALNAFGGKPDVELLARAARGVCHREGLEGFAPASLLDDLAARLWTSGGPSALVWGNWALTWLGSTLIFIALLVGLVLLVRLFPEKRIKRLLFGAFSALLVVVSAASVWHAIKEWKTRRLDLRLTLPIDIVRAGDDSEAVFTNVSALPWLILLRNGQGNFPTPVEAGKLTLDPGAWRTALRQKQWSRVVLTGPLSEYRPLLDHLLVSPDWHLAKVANLGWVFERGPGVPDAVPENLQLDTDLNTAVYLAQLGEKLDAMKKTAEARASITRALELAPNDPIVISHAASFYAERKRWQEVLTYTDKALKNDPDYVHALLLSALAYYELGDFSRAHDVLGRVLLQTPNDFYALLLLARVMRAENDYRGEAEVMERMVRLAGEHRLPQARYLVYLGQAYARQGLAERSAVSYRKALESGELTTQEATDVKSALDLVETRAGLKDRS